MLRALRTTHFQRSSSSLPWPGSSRNSAGDLVALSRRAASSFAPKDGPDGPKREDAQSASLPAWPSGWHDSLQYHFFFEDMFVHSRVFLTPSLEEHSLWIFDHAGQKVVELENSAVRMRHAEVDYVDLAGPRLRIKDGAGGGSLKLGDSEMDLEFKNRNVFSWLPAGQGQDAVIHRPDLEVSMTFGGKTRLGRGYSKRYFGHYGPHWGYRFIQSSWLGGDHFLWTADATFRLGDGEAKYNYFKLLDGRSSELVQAESQDTWQQDTAGYALIGGKKLVARVEPLGEWMHDYKSAETNSRMQLRYCKLSLEGLEGGQRLEGYALNERCFGVLG